MQNYDYVVIGGGIVGLATAWCLLRRKPGIALAVVEKENFCAAHQTGNNSGVIHSGIYYKPDSLKAKLCREGNRRMVSFCRDYGIRHEVCGKVIVATKQEEVPLLDKFFRRGIANDLEVRRLYASEVRQFEPHVKSLAAIHIPTTGIVDFSAVASMLAELIRQNGGELRLGTEVHAFRTCGGRTRIDTSVESLTARFVINCAGLHSDRIAKLAGINPNARIIPFRGEYYELRPERRQLVRNLIYPVPDPHFPFLGVHFTRMIDGSVHAGPNAVLALKREGYQKTDIDLVDFFETVSFAGFWRLARKHFKESLKEIHRSFSKTAFVKSLQQLIPEVTEDDLIPAHAGVRAQALMPNGCLVDDFLILDGRNSIHVCNAPSPAATASLEIASVIVDRVPELSTAVRLGLGSGSAKL
jgi:L-2-hydroxyglutarate oxidase